METVNTVTTETFRHNGTLYGFKLAKVHFGEGIITPEDVLVSKELQETLVAQKSGMIAEVKLH